MAYRRGFQAINDSDVKQVLEAFGLNLGQMRSASQAPPQWGSGWPSFRPQSELWIDQYKAYAAGLGPQEKAELHRDINRIFFSLKEGRVVTEEEHRRKRDYFRQRYIIPSALREGDEAQVWMRLAGAYVDTLLKNKRDALKASAAAEFLTKMPELWLDIDQAGYHDPVDGRAYRGFVFALAKHWKLFLDSYRNEVHGAVVNNTPVAGKLESFLRQRQPDGTPLPKPSNPLVYWPRPLTYYASQTTARTLYEARKAETEALKPTLSFDLTFTVYAFPRWLRLGVKGVDPTIPPPQWRMPLQR